MKQDHFNTVVKSQLDLSLNLLLNKNAAYNPNEDKLHNFRVAAELQGITIKQALAGMMAKHTISIYDMCGSDEDFDLDVWDEKITDSINYLLLLKAVVMDERTRLPDERPSLPKEHINI